jgi:hypothetical protein
MLKFSTILGAIMLLVQYAVAQVNVYESNNHWEIDTLLLAPNPKPWKQDRGEVKNKLRRNKHKFSPIPKKNGNVLQSDFGVFFNSDPAVSWGGMDYESQFATPPDPSVGVGQGYVVQMVNTALQVWDKAGNSVLGPSPLSDVFPGSDDDGDPIVLYDKYAQRWFISQFQISGNQILIAISKSDNPLSGWDFYSFSLADFPDYPKYSIWADGYYMTANSTEENMVVFERDSMIAGAASARMIAMTIPNIFTNGFFSALPLNCATDDLADCSGSNFVFYFEDDGWTGQDDIVKSWKVDVDWNTPSNSTIQVNQEVDVADFDSEFTFSWDDIEQPNTDARLDAVPGALMYMANYYEVQGKNSVVLTHTIDIDPTSEMVAGIRWYDFERSGNNWNLIQQGTYAPNDGKSRFMPSIAKDQSGNIAVAYSISGPNQFPSIAYTGRYNGDEAGKFTLQEKIAFEGFGVQTGTNRYGDYAHMTMDPNDGSLFWFTGEYMDIGGWKTGVFSYRLPVKEAVNLMADRILRPITGDLSDTNSVHVRIRNVGTDTVSNFWTIVDAEGIKDSIFTTTKVAPNQSSVVSGFVSRDLSNFGDYEITAWVNAPGDNQALDDTVRATVKSLPPADVVLDRIISPNSGYDLGVEDITVRLYNNGTDTLYNVPMTYVVDGSSTSDVLDTLLPQTPRNFTFSSTYDFSAIALYSLQIYSAYNGDFDLSNDTINTFIQKVTCSPESDCSFGDNIETLTINGQSNSSDCQDGGYEDFSETPLFTLVEGTNTFRVETNSDWQTVSIWIDWNQNLFFDEEELWVEDIYFDYDTTFLVQLPNIAEAGMFLMRVKIAYGESASNPCDDVFFGETEDYIVAYNVTSSAFAEIEQSFYYSDESNALFFKNQAGRFELFDVGGRLIESSKVQSSTHVLNHLSKGTYVFRYTIANQSFSKKFVIK